MSTYIYAITTADHPMRLTGLSGVGEPAGELRTLTTDTLGAVVSDAPQDLRAKRRDLAAHQGVLDRLMADGAVLPMRFGLVGPGDAEVVGALEENREAYVSRLQELAGRVEFNLKASRDEDDLLREIIGESDEIRRLREVTLREPEAHEEKMRLGELVADEVQAREDAEARQLVERLAQGSEAHVPGEQSKQHFLNVSFLVPRDQAAAFSQTVHEESERRGDAYALSLYGPLPPYSFV